MPSKNPAQRLRDIVDNIEAVEVFLAGQTLETFLADRKTVYAVIRALEIISEASRHLPDDTESKYPHIDWPAIRAAGNVFRHEYYEVDERVIWTTASAELPPLKAAVEIELSRR